LDRSAVDLSRVMTNAALVNDYDHFFSGDSSWFASGLATGQLFN
jgi:hypothetical protein